MVRLSKIAVLLILFPAVVLAGSLTATTLNVGGAVPTNPPGVLYSSVVTPSGTTVTTGSITPTANRLVLAIIAARFNATPADNVISVAGNGLTWVRVAETQVSPGRMIGVYRAMGASPSAGTVVFTESDASSFFSGGSCSVAVVEFAGTDTSGTSGSGAVGTPVENTVSLGTSLGITIPGTPVTGDVTFGVAAVEDDATSFAGDALFVNFTTVGSAGTTESLLKVDYDDGQDTTPTWTWSGANDAMAIGFIIKAPVTTSLGPFTDDFNRADSESLGTNWTEIQGNSYIGSNEVRGDSGNGYNAVIWAPNQFGPSQYMRGTLKLGAGGTETYLWAIFRYTNSSTPYYLVELRTSNTVMSWNVDTTSTINVIESSTSPVISVGQALGFTIEGTGTSTIVRYWANCTGLPSSTTNWNGDTTPDLTFTANPSPAVDAGVSKIGFGQRSATGTLAWDDVVVGSFD